MSMVIGILGGMGSYATLDIFDRLLEAFPAQKEWERPRIVIDNNCTMPSRVVAALHGTGRAQLVTQMTDSVRHLLEAGCTHIFFACNTSHIFLDDVYARIPEARGKIYNIIECLAQDLAAGHVGTPLALIATEGTIQTDIYQSVFAPYHLHIIPPPLSDGRTFATMRALIESVKQHTLCDRNRDEFIALIKQFDLPAVILGCTEFPVLYRAYRQEIDRTGIAIYDPIESVIRKFKRMFIQGGR